MSSKARKIGRHTKIVETDQVRVEDFTEFVCLCELCECGCFERSKLRHHPDCKKQYHPSGKRNSGSCRLTSYQEAYPAHRNVRPRSTQKPPPVARVPPPPTVHSTSQRDSFIPRDLNAARTQPIKREVEYKPSTDRFDGTSVYKTEFVPRAVPQEGIELSKGPVNKSSIKLSSAKFHGVTTSKEHFKGYEGTEHSKAFTELPTIAGSIIYPDKMERDFTTTTKSAYPGAYQPKEQAVHRQDDSLKPEGSMEHSTTHNDTYKKLELNSPTQRFRPPKAEATFEDRPRMEHETQTRRDFKKHEGNHVPRAAEPAPVTIDITYDSRRQFETEQKSKYPGYDVREFEVPKSFKRVGGKYELPSVKMETVTSQKADFKPLDLHGAHVAPIHNQGTLQPKVNAKFDDTTTNKVMFKEHKVEPRLRHYDFVEKQVYLPPSERFGNLTTTQETFVAKHGEPVKSYRPEIKAIETEDTREFGTQHRDTYKPLLREICPSKAYLLALQKSTAGEKQIPPIPVPTN